MNLDVENVDKIRAYLGQLIGFWQREYAFTQSESYMEFASNEVSEIKAFLDQNWH